MTSLLSNKGHDHLHDLNLGVNLASAEMVSTVDQESDDLSRRRRSELGRVVLLLDQASLGVHLDSKRANLLPPVEGVGSTVKKDEHTSVGQRSNANDSLASVNVESVGVGSGSSGGEVVSNSFVDEVKGEDCLESVFRRNLSLVQNPSVLGPAALRSNVGLDDGTTDNSERRIRSLGGELVGDQPIQPSSGDGVLFEVTGLKQSDEAREE